MKKIKKLLLTLLAFYLFVTGAMYLLQEKLIFFPTQLPVDYVYNFNHPFDEIFLETDDGNSLNALHFKNINPKGLIVYYHGNAGDLSRWGNIVSYFCQFNYDVLVMDYRTYGKSTGKLNEQAMYKDAQLFYDKAKESFPEDDIIVYGRSLGTTFATRVAADNHPSQLILESPFYNLIYAAKKRYWFLPIKTLLKYEFPTSNYIQHVKSPITIFHGTDDMVVPYANSEKLLQKTTNNNSKLITVQGGSHNDLIDFTAYTGKIEVLLR